MQSTISQRIVLPLNLSKESRLICFSSSLIQPAIYTKNSMICSHVQSGRLSILRVSFWFQKSPEYILEPRQVQSKKKSALAHYSGCSRTPAFSRLNAQVFSGFHESYCLMENYRIFASERRFLYATKLKYPICRWSLKNPLVLWPI